MDQGSGWWRGGTARPAGQAPALPNGAVVAACLQPFGLWEVEGRAHGAVESVAEPRAGVRGRVDQRLQRDGIRGRKRDDDVRHGLDGKRFGAINAHLAAPGHRLQQGKIVDASIIVAPSSTKNRELSRDTEMLQTKQGHPWYFGIKAHIGVDAASGLTHCLEMTLARLHGSEERVGGDAGDRGVGKRAENRRAPLDWQVATTPGKRRRLDQDGAEEAAETCNASFRVKGSIHSYMGSGTSAMRRYATEDWRRTPSASPCSSASRTC